jgi:hypothetical protein
MVFWCIPKIEIFFVVPLICYFGHEPFNRFLIFVVLLMILNLLYIMTGIAPELTGSQHSCLSSAKSTKSATHESCLPTISFASSISKHMGLHLLQDSKERRCQHQRKKMEELVAFLQESTRAVHPLAILRTFWSLQITRSICSQNLLEVLHLSKSIANTQQI